MSGTLSDLLARYGYLFIALFMFIESIGIPIPGESALITAAALAGAGKLSIVGVFFSALAGSVFGGMAGYWMGVRGGHAIVSRFGRLLRINDQRMARAHTFFEKHGASALIVGRYIAVVRSFLGIFAGVSAMPKRKFLLYNALGGLIWSLTFCIVGYFFGRNIPALMREIGRVSLVLAIVLALVILLVVGWRWFSANGPRHLAMMQERWRRLDAQPWVVTLRRDHPTVWRLVLFKFVRGEYLALHLAVGWVVSVFALVIFGAITEDVVEGAPLTPVDAALASGLGQVANDSLMSLFAVVAGFGGPMTIALIAAVMAAILVARRRWLSLGAWIGAYAGGVALDILLRRIVQRAELPLSPDLFNSGLLASLPTGHTVGAVVTFGLIAHLLVRRAHSGTIRVAIVTVTLALLTTIVVARLFLGSSYLSTESASVAVGVLWLAACISGLELARFRRSDPRELSP